jgi:methionine biosynthesis protein MetW
MTLRPDLALVAELIPQGSRVLDLGCGSGELLAELMAEAGCRGTGVEIDPPSVLAAIAAGVPVVELDLDSELHEFADRSYDVVVLSRTVQTLHRPVDVLQHMGRIGERLIVSVPNFGYWRHRLRLLRGRMPMSREIPHAWYDTPNLRHTTLVELEQLFDKLGLVVEQRIVLSPTGVPAPSGDRFANLVAGSAVYVLRG